MGFIVRPDRSTITTETNHWGKHDVKHALTKSLIRLSSFVAVVAVRVCECVRVRTCMFAFCIFYLLI